MNTRLGFSGMCVVAVMTGVAQASIERSVDVAQPIVTEEQLCIGNVTYITLSHDAWGDIVDFTDNENFVLISGWDKPVNRNAANLAGIKTYADVFHFQEQALYGDTIRVVLDLSSMDAAKADCEASDLVHATIDCMLINASRCLSAWDSKVDGIVTAKHVRLDVLGSTEFASLAQTYAADELKNYPTHGCYGP